MINLTKSWHGLPIWAWGAGGIAVGGAGYLAASSAAVGGTAAPSGTTASPVVKNVPIYANPRTGSNTRALAALASSVHRRRPNIQYRITVAPPTATAAANTAPATQTQKTTAQPPAPVPTPRQTVKRAAMVRPSTVFALTHAPVGAYGAQYDTEQVEADAVLKSGQSIFNLTHRPVGYHFPTGVQIAAQRAADALLRAGVTH